MVNNNNNNNIDYSTTDVCSLLKQKFLKFNSKITTLLLDDVFINQACVDGLVHLLFNSSLIELNLFGCIFSSNNEFDDLITAIATSELKELGLKYIGVDLEMGKSLARLQISKTLEVVRLMPMDCSVARLLDAAMTHSSVRYLTPDFCGCREVIHIYSLGDRVTLFPKFKYYHFYKHNRYYYHNYYKN